MYNYRPPLKDKSPVSAPVPQVIVSTKYWQRVQQTTWQDDSAAMEVNTSIRKIERNSGTETKGRTHQLTYVEEYGAFFW